MKRSFYLLILVIVVHASAHAQPSPRFVAEYEPAWGTLIRWPLGIPSNLVVDLAEHDSLYVLVESPFQRDQAIDAFTGWGVNLDLCKFIFAQTYSHWTRDWGPHYVFNSAGVAGIADPVFDGYPWVPGCNTYSGEQPPMNPKKEILGWEEDDAVNAILADSFNCPQIDLTVYLTGGNIMVDGYNTAISTQQMLDENIPVASQETFFQILQDSLGITNYIVVDNPEVHGIQHIDCYAKFLDEERILVKEVDTWHPEFACCEALAEALGNEESCWGNPYEIIRIYCGSYNGDEVAAYTNSLILNNKIYVPLFGIDSDTEAMATYEAAMPGYDVHGYEWADWYYYDALHCRTMGIFDRHMLRIEHQPYSGSVVFGPDPKFVARVDDRSEAGLVSEELKFWWRSFGSSTWDYTDMIALEDPNTYYGFIPYPVIGTTYEYYLSAMDSTGRYVTAPRYAPENFFSFTLENVSAADAIMNTSPALQIQPSVFSKYTTLLVPGSSPGARVTIWNLNGRLVRSLRPPAGGQSGTIKWDGRDQQQQDCPGGTYIIRLESENVLQTAKCVLVR